MSGAAIYDGVIIYVLSLCVEFCSEFCSEDVVIESLKAKGAVDHCITTERYLSVASKPSLPLQEVVQLS